MDSQQQQLTSTPFNEAENLHLDLDVENRNKNEYDDGDGQNAEAVNPLMMEDILDFVCLRLDMKSLKTVRQVNKLWAKSATRRMFDVGFFRFRVPPNFYKQSKEEQEAELNELKAFFLRRISRIQNIGLFEQGDVEILRSLGVLGSNIKDLKLSFCKLHPEYMDFIKSDLCSLTHLTNADSNDQEINSEFLTNISSLNRPLLLSGLSFYPSEDEYGEKDFQILEQISRGKVKTRKFQFQTALASRPQEWPQISAILSQFLLNNRDELEEICLKFFAGILPDFQFPVLPNVTKFVCHIFPDIGLGYEFRLGFAETSLKFLERGFLMTSNFRFVEHLPNLSHVEICCAAFGGTMLLELCHVLTNSFGLAGIAPSVKTAKCHNNRIINTDILSTIFPNAKITVSYLEKK